MEHIQPGDMFQYIEDDDIYIVVSKERDHPRVSWILMPVSHSGKWTWDFAEALLNTDVYRRLA